jgi:hypothetical protein
MFFYIGKQKPFSALTTVAENLHLDDGWTTVIKENENWGKITLDKDVSINIK